jgi:hypothetical protein
MSSFNFNININTGLAEEQAAKRCICLSLRPLVLRQLLLTISAKQAVATEGQRHDE